MTCVVAGADDLLGPVQVQPGLGDEAVSSGTASRSPPGRVLSRRSRQGGLCSAREPTAVARAAGQADYPLGQPAVVVLVRLAGDLAGIAAEGAVVREAVHRLQRLILEALVPDPGTVRAFPPQLGPLAAPVEADIQ
jgi:hypothetical protein